MGTALSVEELRERFKDIIENKEVRVISQWKEPNSHVPFNDEEYLDGIADYAKKCNEKTEEALAELEV